MGYTLVTAREKLNKTKTVFQSSFQGGKENDKH
jgi:hypothetical protein